MSNKKILIISICSMLSVIMIIVGLIFFSINKRENTITENIAMIKSNFAIFSDKLRENNEITSSLLENVALFDKKTYEQEHENTTALLEQYDKNIKNIDFLVKDTKKRCEYKYEDITIQLFCKGYDAKYEETINGYIKNINNYNEKLTKYNETIDNPYELHKLVYDEYIDYDKDGKYEGK